MKLSTYLKTTALFILLLITSLPVCLATQLNLTYDANGNLINGDGKHRTYNSLNQLSKIYNGSDTNATLLQEYTYHPTQERILKKHDYTKNETTYYFNENFVRVVNTSGSYDYTYVKHNGQLIAQVNPDSSKIYIHGDHLGLSTVITNESGNMIKIILDLKTKQ